MTKTRSKGRAKGKNPHWGSTLDEFLEEKGTRETFRAVAIKEVLAWQIKKAIKARGLSRNRMAKEMRTSRSQICLSRYSALPIDHGTCRSNCKIPVVPII